MTAADNNLYLIWDYRTTTAITLCQNLTDTGVLAQYNACCTCAPPVPTTPCNQTVGYTGGINYPDVRNIDVGTSTGVVTIRFRAQSVPDRMIVKFDGVTVIDSQYHGANAPDTIARLHAKLSSINPDTGSGYVEPTSGQSYVPNGTAPLPTVANGGFIDKTNIVYKTFTFNKTTATTIVEVNVYGPLFGTAYDVEVQCPT